MNRASTNVLNQLVILNNRRVLNFIYYVKVDSLFTNTKKEKIKNSF